MVFKNSFWAHFLLANDNFWYLESGLKSSFLDVVLGHILGGILGLGVCFTLGLGLGIIVQRLRKNLPSLRRKNLLYLCLFIPFVSGFIGFVCGAFRLDWKRFIIVSFFLLICEILFYRIF